MGEEPEVNPLQYFVLVVPFVFTLALTLPPFSVVLKIGSNYNKNI